MVIERDTGKRRYVDLVFQRVGNLLCQQRVQGMDTFNNQYGVAGQLQFLSVPFPFTRHEVILRNLHPFPLHESQQMVFEQVILHGLDIVEIVVAIRQFRCIQAVHEIVIGRERQRAQSAGKQLHAESFTECCLAR